MNSDFKDEVYTFEGWMEELLEDWLKGERAIAGYPGAEKQRKAVLAVAEQHMDGRSSVQNIIDKMEAELIVREDSDTRLFRDFLTQFTGEGEAVPRIVAEEIAVSPNGAPNEEEKEPESERDNIIGRVALTQRSPAKPYRFSFWVKNDPTINVETGTIVTARPSVIESGRSSSYLVGIITDIEVMSDVESPLDSFYSHAYGNPDQQLSLSPTVVTIPTAEVLHRADNRAEPPRGHWLIAHATAAEIRQAYGSTEIPKEREILGGFVFDQARNPVALPLDASYLVGYEAAHINIAGASGAASKTSYGLFLLQSLLAWGNRSEGTKNSIAAIAFNVKEADLMRIDNLPKDWEDAEDRMKATSGRRDHISMWRYCRDELELDPFILKRNFAFYAPEDAYGQKATIRDGSTTGFNYGLQDLLDNSRSSLLQLMEPRDIDDLASSALIALADKAADERLSFTGLLSELNNLARSTRQNVDIGTSSHHTATVRKLNNRLPNAVNNQLWSLLNRGDRRGSPLPIHQLSPGDLWTVDISRMQDKGQRLVFQTVLAGLQKILEAKRSGNSTVQIGDQTVDTASFPSRVVVFVDELNKFAPSGRQGSALKEDVIEIAARGRSVGLGLLGIQQLASKVDDEILANCTTFALGRTHVLEMSQRAYAWVPGGLKERVVSLDRGQILLWHGVHKRPALVRFPIPLHHLSEIELRAKPRLTQIRSRRKP